MYYRLCDRLYWETLNNWIYDYELLHSIKGYILCDSSSKSSDKTCLTPPLLIEVPVQSQESERACICLPLSTIFLLDFATV
jgi:hypothetical protein